MPAPPPIDLVGRNNGKRDAPASSSPVTPRSDQRVEGNPRRPSPGVTTWYQAGLAFVGRRVDRMKARARRASAR
jgi:hypothetical protein